jgi:hypothetical protein
MTTTTQEWTAGAVAMLTEWIRDTVPGVDTRAVLQVTVGPMPRKRGARGTGDPSVLGLCEYSVLPSAAKTGRQITVTDTESSPVEVLHIIAHELIHAFMPVDEGHGKRFEAAVRLIGLTGKPSATRPGPDFKVVAREIVAVLGDYPHRAVKVRRPRQGNPMHKVVCSAGCGCIVRASSKWVGTPDEPNYLTCMNCGGPATVAEWGMTREQRVRVNAALDGR